MECLSEDIDRAPRLTQVMSRVRIDLTPLLRDPGFGALNSAAAICKHCRWSSNCDRWSSERDEGEAHEPPTFCAAVAYLSAAHRQ